MYSEKKKLINITKYFLNDRKKVLKNHFKTKKVSTLNTDYRMLSKNKYFVEKFIG